MKTSALPLPEYEKPPVVEVAISLQFAPLERMRTSHAGILWGGLRREFPRIEEYPPLDPVFESFATPAPQTTLRSESFGAQAPPLRVWFMNDAKDQLIQLQRDRLVVNWRQGAGSYPRFHQIIRHFHTALSEFRRLVKTEALGEITPNQCEITYVNHMPAGLGWQQP